MNNMRFSKLFKSAALLALIGAGLMAHAQSNPEAVFATVNGEEIKAGEFWHRLAWFHIDPKNPMATLPAGFLTINQLVSERLIFQMAHDKGVSPTDEQVQAEMKQEEAADPNILSDLRGQGRPESDLYQDTKYQLAQYNLETFGITVTDQEVEGHYKTYPSEFTSPKTFTLKVIVVQSDAEQAAVDADLSAGKAFGDVAKARSNDVSKSNSGEFGKVTESQLNKPILDALQAVQIGQATPWIAGAKPDSPRVKYLVEDVTAPKLHPLDDNLRRQIRHRLSVDKGAIKNNVIADLNAATVTAKVVIYQAGFQKIYDQLMTQYKQAHPQG